MESGLFFVYYSDIVPTVLYALMQNERKPMNELVLVIDFGGQYKQLIARRVRECNVYCEIISYTTPIEEIKKRAPKGIILTGGPNSVYDPASPTAPAELFNLGIPVLGICYGSQLMAYRLGGDVKQTGIQEKPFMTARNG